VAERDASGRSTSSDSALKADQRGSSSRQAGAALHHAIWTDEAIDLLPDAGWNDGGCGILANALVAWVGEDMAERWAVVSSGDGVAHHVVCRVGDWYLDADGASTAPELLARWRPVFGSDGSRLLAIALGSLDAARILHDEPLSRRLAALLVRLLDREAFRRSFGPEAPTAAA
jgi:hypothetical protein